MTARFVDDPTDLVLRMAVALDQLAVAIRLLERIEILALDILDQRELRRGRFVDLANDRRNGVEPCPLRRAPAPLAGDDHIIFAVGPEQNRLENPALPDRLGELVECLLVEVDSRLMGVGPDPRDLDLPHAAARSRWFVRPRRRRLPPRFPEQCLQAHPQAFCGPLAAHAAAASWGRRPINSRASRIYASDPGH